jgi:hypothetical protein
MCSAAWSRDDGVSRVAVLRIGKHDALTGRRIVVLLPIQDALGLYYLPKRAPARWLRWIDG